MNPDESDLTARAMKLAVESAILKKAEDLKVLSLGEVASFCDYFIILTVTSQKQAQAVSDSIVENLKREKIRPLSEEGYTGGRWILLDYIDFIVHVFQPEERQFYALERLWGDAGDVTEDFLT